MVNLPPRREEKLAIEKCLRSFIIKSIHTIVQARNGIVCNTNCVSEVGARNNMMVYVEEDPEIGATIKQTLDANFPVHVQDLLSLEILAHWPKEPQMLMVVEVWQFRLDIMERLNTTTLQFTNSPNPTIGNTTTTTNNNNSNIHHHYQQQPQLNFLQRTSPNCSVASMLQQNHYRQQQSSIQQEMFPLSCAPSVSSMNNNISHYSRMYSGNSNNNNNGIVGRDSPIPGNNMDSNPSGTINSQLMFGVKVLPNVVTPQLLNNTNSSNPSNHHQSRLPQRGGLMRQTSCEPSVISGPQMNNNTIGGGSLSRSQMNSTLLTDRHSSQEFMQQQQQFHYANNIHNSRQSSFLQSQYQASGVGDSTSKGQKHQLFTDDGVTSFIE